MEFPPFLTKIMGGMKLIEHWMFARTDRQMAGQTTKMIPICRYNPLEATQNHN
jgi:hypothetical protein